ncbi:hypothetical protein [Paraburkholderia kirstenboschensis]|uniref:hypothetical protein n=1 Tax=Paraburkholderia kirstenboschensis TaxID=1245436 RepID=UPI0019189E0F|nr:hypothetical protein [Paraburkholderia kirstenboschensis]
MEKHLLEARKLLLLGMRDIINYICAALIFGNQVYEHRVIVGWWKVFERVRSAWQKR